MTCFIDFPCGFFSFCVKLSTDSSSSFRIPDGAEAYTESFSRSRSEKTGLSASSISSSGRKQIGRPDSLPHSHPTSRVFSDAQSSTDFGLADDEHTRSILRYSTVSSSQRQLDPRPHIKTPKVKHLIYNHFTLSVGYDSL